MAIKLRVISDQYRELGEHRSRVFGVNGGTIGRAPDNDWILPDSKRVVSGHHCEIEYRSGGFWLKDTSTNGVFVNEAEEPASRSGRVELRDGDRLRLGDYEILVSVDSRIDFLPPPAEKQSASRHVDADIGHAARPAGSLLSPRDAEQSGSMRMRNAFGMKMAREDRKPVESNGHAEPPEPPQPPHSNDRPFAVVESARPAASASPAPAASANGAATVGSAAALCRSPASSVRAPRRAPRRAPASVAPARAAADNAPGRGLGPQDPPDHAPGAGRGRRTAPGPDRPTRAHRSVSPAGHDLDRPALRRCRRSVAARASNVNALTPEAQSMLPLLAGQLLREVVVGLTDTLRARPETPAAGTPLQRHAGRQQPAAHVDEHRAGAAAPVRIARPSVRRTCRRAARRAAGHQGSRSPPRQDAMRAGLQAMLEQLAPTNVADQFEHGRSRALAPGQDPRPKYWEHYGEFYRVLTQQGPDGAAASVRRGLRARLRPGAHGAQGETPPTRMSAARCSDESR